MSLVLDGTTGITNDGGYTGDGVVFADTTPSNTLVTTTGGNVGIGTSSPNNYGSVYRVLQASATDSGIIQATGTTNSVTNEIGTTGVIGQVGTRTNHVLAFKTNDTERARIDTRGNLLVGTTSIIGGLNGLNMVDKNIVQRNSASAAGRFRWQGVDNSNTLIVYDQNNTGVYMVNGGTAWTANSDERIKTTLIPFENAAAKVCTLRAGTGRYLTDEKSVSRSFLIAQDVQAVLPEAVHVQGDEIGTLGLQYTDVIPLLVAAIQDQQALITALTARVEALEGQP
jgi:hypothetical protein